MFRIWRSIVGLAASILSLFQSFPLVFTTFFPRKRMDFSPFLHSLFLAVNAKIETCLHQLGVFWGAILAPWGSLGRPSLVLSPPMRENTAILGGGRPFGRLLGVFWAPSGPLWRPMATSRGSKWLQHRLKISKKSTKTCTSILHLFFHRLFTKICSPTGHA